MFWFSDFLKQLECSKCMFFSSNSDPLLLKFPASSGEKLTRIHRNVSKLFPLSNLCISCYIIHILFHKSPIFDLKGLCFWFRNQVLQISLAGVEAVDVVVPKYLHDFFRCWWVIWEFHKNLPILMLSSYSAKE